MSGASVFRSLGHMPGEILTIGHANHDSAYFLALLRRHAVTAAADVRSHPYSRYNPQFRKGPLEAALCEAGIAYVFLGRELGARSENPECYVDGRVQYARLAREPLFRQGLDRILQGSKRYRIALVCAEKDPVRCHRAVLVCRELRALVDRIDHIHGDGSIESNTAFEQRLLALHGLVPDMLTTEQACIEAAYDRQAAKIAYVDDNMKAAAN